MRLPQGASADCPGSGLAPNRRSLCFSGTAPHCSCLPSKALSAPLYGLAVAGGAGEIRWNWGSAKNAVPASVLALHRKKGVRRSVTLCHAMFGLIYCALLPKVYYSEGAYSFEDNYKDLTRNGLAGRLLPFSSPSVSVVRMSASTSTGGLQWSRLSVPLERWKAKATDAIEPLRRKAEETAFLALGISDPTSRVF
ncbi:hypothetical protein CALCODRAFT_331996 [Calocera cornea HHB12733]|uniref:Uncharacterized protein n=1 Tax=Calocera cornea HHB12733 TaxID=1353952 RepID=A0A165F2W1_9BASI|nr:hypothetical protein CALCODRAFT_331996 [Calocera cornea HHB12733]